jgi:tRNA(Met) C34 N-acetyltransferase TmcA
VPVKTDVRRLIQSQLQNFKRRLYLSLKDLMNLFTALKIDTVLLSTNPATWSSCAAFVDAKQKVVNMTAVQYMLSSLQETSTMLSVLTQDEAQQLLMFQIVEYHRRRRLPNPLNKNYIAL